jgi:hypothetical protein
MDNSTLGGEEPICDDCAKALGGTWPEDYIATVWPATCACCGEGAKCTAVSDWTWLSRPRRKD